MVGIKSHCAQTDLRIYSYVYHAITHAILRFNGTKTRRLQKVKFMSLYTYNSSFKNLTADIWQL